MMTFLQFCDSHRAMISKEYPDTTPAEYAEAYPKHALREDWRKWLWGQVRDNKTLPKHVCRDAAKRLGPDFLPSMARYHENAIPKDVLFATGLTA